MEATTHTELVAPFAGCMQELPGIFGWRPSGRNDQSGSVQGSAAKPTAGHYCAPLPCAGCCSSSDFSPLVRRDWLYAQHWPRAAFMVKIMLRELLLRKLDLPYSTLQCLGGCTRNFDSCLCVGPPPRLLEEACRCCARSVPVVRTRILSDPLFGCFFSTSTDAVWAWCPGHR